MGSAKFRVGFFSHGYGVGNSTTENCQRGETLFFVGILSVHFASLYFLWGHHRERPLQGMFSRAFGEERLELLRVDL